MIIKLKESKLFTKDPAIRFADEYRISPEIYKELWRRYKLLEYSIPELCEVFYIKVGRPMKRKNMDEWMFRGNIYMLTYDKMKIGVEIVNSSFFGEYEQRVMKELLKHMKSGETRSVKTLA